MKNSKRLIPPVILFALLGGCIIALADPAGDQQAQPTPEQDPEAEERVADTASRTGAPDLIRPEDLARIGEIARIGEFVLPEVPRLPTPAVQPLIPAAHQPATPAASHRARIVLSQFVSEAEGHLVVVGFSIPIGEPQSSFVWLTPRSGPSFSLAGGSYNAIPAGLGDLGFGEVAPYTVYGTLLAHVVPRRRGIFRQVDSDDHFMGEAEALVNRVSARLREEFASVDPVRDGATRDEMIRGVAEAIELTYQGLGRALSGWHAENSTTNGVAFWIHAPGLSEVEIRGAAPRLSSVHFVGGLTSPGPFVLHMAGEYGFVDDGIHGVLH